MRITQDKDKKALFPLLSGTPDAEASTQKFPAYNSFQGPSSAPQNIEIKYKDLSKILSSGESDSSSTSGQLSRQKKRKRQKNINSKS